MKNIALVRVSDTLLAVSEAKTTVQNATQRFDVTKPPVELTNTSNSPADGCPPNSDKVLPDSFADWLARPARTITNGPEPEPGIFLGLPSNCHIRITEEGIDPSGHA